MAVWVGVIAALGGVLIGGGLALLNGRLQFKQQVHRERQKLLLSKLEELYDLIGQVRRSYEASALERVNSYLNIETPAEVRSAIPTPIERVQLLVSFYAPELAQDLFEFDKFRMTYGEVIGNAILQSKSDTKSQQKALANLQVESQKIDEACRTLQARVVALSKNYL
ncbi:MAG: hypothetical protein QOE96_3038 [Blastocatellia bacterium]|jgi:hypothetical protein|nr:hypothetical protein [Blastocatellia bacterium]